MELQESSVRNAHTYIAFPRTPRFLDVRGQLVQRLSDALELEDWFTDEDPPRVMVRGDAPETFAGISEDSSVLGRDDPTSLSDMQERSRIGQAEVLETLAVREVGYIGAGVVAVAPAEDFAGLALWLADRLGPEPRIRGTFGGNPSNAWWKLVWEHGQKGFAVDIGPMSADAPAAETSFLNSEALELPPTFLFIDVRRTIKLEESPMASADAVHACADALADAWSALERFDQELRSSQ